MSTNSSETFTIHDVSTPVSDLLAYRPACGSYPPPPGCLPPAPNSNYGQMIFNDLGSGPIYGTSQVFPSDVNNVLSIELSTDAINAINQAISSGKMFAAGISLNNLLGSPNEKYILFSDTEESPIHQLNLTPVPIPSTMLLLGSGLVGLIGFRRKFKR